MLIVNWKQTAINDLEGITTYIFDHNPIAALTLADEILQTAERLADMPYKWSLDVLMEREIYIKLFSCVSSHLNSY